ncbi:hypothetical protein [Rhodococcus ruber]|uniref:Acb2/Tad1 domain-containing protein n=1 Tax=Rhodococcus ruber TaxID=1830 RepID=UPI00378427BA
MSYADTRSTADIDNRFDFHPATTAEKRGEHGSIREACKALALTKLEEAMFWANAGIARQGEEA